MSTSPALRRSAGRWLPVIAVMGLLFLLSSQSGLQVSEDPVVDRPFRVTGHLLAYATLAGLSLAALSWDRRPRVRDAVVAFGIAVVYGVSDEVHQAFVPGRTGRIDDVVTDAIGALLGIAVAWVVLEARARARATARNR